MSFETAKAIVDFLLADPVLSKEKAVIWDFIGGEPFLEIELIDKVTDYIKERTYELGHHWFDMYRIQFSTNGTLYHTPAVQEYIRKNYKHLSIAITIDGSKYKHDLMRVYKDGSGSYDLVESNYKMWMEQFPHYERSTKATFAHDDLHLIKESIIHLWNIGVEDVMANVVFEDVWEDGDDTIYENQLKELADYVIDNKLWDKYSVRFFSTSIGSKLEERDLVRNHCGSGSSLMIAFDADGNVYPCLRFIGYSLNNKKAIVYGNIFKNDFNYDMLRRFAALDLKSQSTEECLKCEVATDCAFCTGYNYDAALTDTVYQRSIGNCKMHKANARAAEYFWNRYEDVTGEKSPLRLGKEARAGAKYLAIINGDISHCCYQISDNSSIMGDEMIARGLKYAQDTGYEPVLIGNKKVDGCLTIGSIGNGAAYIIVFSSGEDSIEDCREKISDRVCIYRTNRNQLPVFANELIRLAKAASRVNVRITDVERWSADDFEQYKAELKKVATVVFSKTLDSKIAPVDILTDRIDLFEMRNCDMGEASIALAPNGKFYICPAFYFNNSEDNVGDLVSGINIPNDYLMRLENAPICNVCDAYHCTRCKWLNKLRTGEYNIPSKNQCLISHVEREVIREFTDLLIEKGVIPADYKLLPINYSDPLEKFLEIQEHVVNRKGVFS